MDDEKVYFDIGVFAVIVNEQNKILHIRRNDIDIWETPGGRLEPKETPEQAIIREVKEEVGLDIKVEKLSGIYVRPHNNGIIFNFVCSVIPGSIIVLSKEEARDVEWFDIDEIPKNSSPYKTERIKDALLNKNDVIYKIQDGPSVRDLFS
ncbi:MAG: NUDIX hydrolase [Candidatus Magasanikiibacteriota bacterium]